MLARRGTCSQAYSSSKLDLLLSENGALMCRQIVEGQESPLTLPPWFSPWFSLWLCAPTLRGSHRSLLRALPPLFPPTLNRGFIAHRSVLTP